MTEVMKATLLEPETSDTLEVTAYEPGIQIEANFEPVRRYIAEKLEIYQGEHSINDEDDYQQAKRSRSAMTRLKSEVDSERKRIKAIYMEPVEAFETKVKELLSPVDETRAAIDAAVKAYEAEWVRRKESALASYYGEIAPFLVPLVPFQRIQKHAESQGKKWMNRTYQEMNARADIEQIVTEIGTNERTIEKLAHDTSEAEVVKAAYFNSLDFGAATRQLEHLESQRAKLAELEANRKELAERTQSPKKAVEVEEHTSTQQKSEKPTEPEVYRFTAKFSATNEQMRKTAEFWQSLGLTGEITRGERL